MRKLNKLYWPGVVTLNSVVDGDVIIAWCDENVGKKRYYPMGKVFYFKNTKDATMFALRWT